MPNVELTVQSNQLMAPRVAASGSGLRTFCTFRVGEGLYGIDVISLREVSTNTTITPMPQAPKVIRGLANLRSTILLVLDLRPLLGLEPVECTAESRLIILKSAVADNIGILVDGGGEVRLVPPERIENRDESQRVLDDGAAGLSEAAQSLVIGVAKLENQLMMIIDAARFESTIERMV